MKRNNDSDFEDSARSSRIFGDEAETDGTPQEFKDKDVSELHFRKTMHGYNMSDVSEYINEQNKNFMSACQMYEGKITELRAEVAFLNRERDSLLKKLEESRQALEETKAEIAAAQSEHPKTESVEEVAEEPVEAEKSEVQQPVEEKPQSNKLANDYQILVDEVAGLRKEKVEMQSAIEELTRTAARLDDVSQENSTLSDTVAALKKEAEEKDTEITRLLEIERQLSTAKDEAEELRRVCALEQKKREASDSELKGKAEIMGRAANEIENLRKEISEFEIRQSVLRQQLKKSDNEIAEMREQNKKQAYEYASKVSDIEAEYNSSKIKMQKQIQVHMYHIKQVDLLLEEMRKQFDDARASLESIESNKN